jgi:hypothetical protein
VLGSCVRCRFIKSLRQLEGGWCTYVWCCKSGHVEVCVYASDGSHALRYRLCLLTVCFTLYWGQQFGAYACARLRAPCFKLKLCIHPAFDYLSSDALANKKHPPAIDAP